MGQSRTDAIDARMEAACERLQALLSQSPSAELDSIIEGELRQLLEAYADHIDESESPDGLLIDLTNNHPGLQVDVATLRREHTDLADRFCRLLASQTDRAGIAAEATEILAALALHRRRGTELMYRAFSDEPGGAG